MNYQDPSITFNAEFKMPRVQVKGKDPTVAADAASQAYARGFARGIKEAGTEMPKALNEAMAQSVWGWPRTTIRRNSSVTTKPRDIIDTANLRDSMDVDVSGQATSYATLTITYTAPYAAITHYGGMIRPYGRKTGDTVILPARPWISSMLTGTNGIEEFKVLDFVEKSVMKEWKNRYQKVITPGQP